MFHAALMFHHASDISYIIYVLTHTLSNDTDDAIEQNVGELKAEFI